MSKVEYGARRDIFILPKEQPVTQFINVGYVATQHCNLECVHCCEDKRTQDMGSPQTERQTIGGLVNGGTRRVCVTGGEPLARKDITDLLKLIHTQGISITLATNGSLLTEAKMQEIRPHIDNIRFSLHGEESTHDRITGQKGSFGMVMKGIEHAKNFNLPIGIIFTVMVQNYPEVLSVAKLCAEKGVDVLHLFSLISKGRGVQIYPQEYISPIRIKQVAESLSNIARQESWKLRVDAVNWGKEGQCVLVYPNGDLIGTPSFANRDIRHEKLVGNLLRQTPDELWESYPFKENYIIHCRDH